MSSIRYLPENTTVHFDLEGSFPLFRERYISAQAGIVTIKGIINQTALLEPTDGISCRIAPPKKDDLHENQIVYSAIRLSDKTEVFRLLTPARLDKGTVPQLRYRADLDGRQYVFRQVKSGRREFDLWDGSELHKVVEQDKGRYVVGDLTVLISVPCLLVLLFPWLNNQTIMVQK